MGDVQIGYPGEGTLTLFDVTRHPSGEIATVTVRLDGDGASATQRVTAHYASHFDDLIRFLEDLAESWQGWIGEKNYTSLQGELKVTATQDHLGHVVITSALRGPNVPHDWELSVTFQTDAGAQMEEAAKAARILLESGV